MSKDDFVLHSSLIMSIMYIKFDIRFANKLPNFEPLNKQFLITHFLQIVNPHFKSNYEEELQNFLLGLLPFAAHYLKVPKMHIH